MAICENPICRENRLSKEDLERDLDSGMLLCPACYVSKHPSWKPRDFVNLPEVISSPEFNYEVTLDNRAGLRAQISHGGLSLTLRASTKSLRDIFGVTLR